MGPRILREIEIATNSNVPQIPKVFEVETKSIGSNAYTYIIEQYIDGNSLAVEFRKNIFSLEKSINLLESLLQTVVELEKVGVVHRDIKPDNIICARTGEFYLIDFGIARVLGSTSLTMTEMAIGPHTPGYGAPELFNYSKRDIDSRADLFSIGVVIYESIFHKHPFITGDEIDVHEILMKTSTVLPQEHHIPEDKDRNLIGFIQTLMQKHISKRPPSAERALEWFYIVKRSLDIDGGK
ncbi:MAG: protein kinase [Lascolabacillus sp.]|uniref:serine/threonine protein kinase n=1 Tax=Lascolabacillus sp. TaxID=1924068 RepID=UPI0025838279|nr:protein kinase [Lascolabacillus sp.]MDD4759179.1 protein kinase [Lascolabacillus sp.]